MKHIATLALVATISSCSALKSRTQDVFVECNHPNAVLYREGTPIGVGSTTVALDRHKRHALRAVLPDGRQAMETIVPRWSTSATFDAIGGTLFLVPAVGLLTPGVFNLSSTKVTIYIPHVLATTTSAKRVTP